MVIVNGKKIKVYTLDDLNTFKNRLAYKLKTLPIYLYFPDGISYEDIIQKDKNIKVENILSQIIESSKENKDIKTLIDNIKEKFGLKYDIKEKVLPLWVAYNKKIVSDYSVMGNSALDILSKQLIELKVIKSRTQLVNIAKDINFIKKSFETDLSLKKNQVKEYLKIFKEYENIEESLIYTDFRTEYVQFMLTLNINNISILEIFNNIKLNETAPFATIKYFYKILKDFIPPEEWTETRDDEIILKVNQKQLLINKNKNTDYVDTILRNTDDGKLSSKITINTSKDNLSRDGFIERSLKVISPKDKKIKVEKIEENKIAGVFYYPTETLDKYVFADLVMNDDLYSMLISIDDHEKATKKKSGIYIHFQHPSTGYITATVTEKRYIKGDQTLKEEDIDLFESFKSYIRVRVSKADNLESIENFQEIFGKLMSLYGNKYNTIVEEYRQYIPDFGSIEVEEEDENEDTAKNIFNIAPDIFKVTGYSTICGPYRQPNIISEQEALETDKKVMKFPRDIPENEDMIKFPMDGQDQNYYVCNNKNYPYPGLQLNNNKNSDMYPYVPCCFERDQTNKPKYLHYYEGKERKQENKDKGETFLITNKFLTNKQKGTLPPNLESLFIITNPSDKFQQVRKGVLQTDRKYKKRNEHSFLACVMEALDDETGITKITDPDEREAALIDVRTKLATKELAPLCKQEMYDYTIDQIISMIKDPTLYLDPKLFIHLLESYFECNIFLFTKKFLNGEMILPRHTQAYYKNFNKNRCIYIYEHMGSESDSSKFPYPQCELIIRHNKIKNEDFYSFSYEESKNIIKVFNKLRESYALSKIIRESVFPIPKKLKIISQWIDSYGKTRILNVEFAGKIISMIVSPIQPINTKQEKSSKINYIDIDTALEFTTYLTMNIEYQNVLNDKIKQLRGLIGNVSVSIPINDSNPLDNIETKEIELEYPIETVSELDTYNRNKKFARYIVEYMIWIYSYYLKNKNITKITDESIAKFSNKYFDIKPNYNYKAIPKTFSKSSTVMNGNKIVIQSEEMKKRLVYVLRLLCIRNSDSVFEYHKRKVIQNYYEDISDFNQYKNQVLLYGQESINKWIFENNVNYILYDEVLIGSTKPYFFKNNLIDNKIYLAQNTTSIGKACDIAINWFRNDYNIGVHSKDITPVSFILYSYVNSENITSLSVNGKSFSHEVKIIGYKINDKAFYTPLLSLS
tara:strand:- start:1057 stop:4662 length:3606 start_codon:yes stop_codon:yes gene_type:complete